MIKLIEVHAALYESVDGKCEKIKGMPMRIAPKYIQAIQEVGTDSTTIMFGDYWHAIYEPIQQVLSLLRAAGE